MKKEILDAINEISIQESMNEMNVCGTIAEAYEKFDILQEYDVDTYSFDMIFQEGDTLDAIKEDVKRQNEGKSTVNKVFFTLFRLLASIYNAITGKLKTGTISSNTTDNIKKNRKKRKSSEDSIKKGFVLAGVGVTSGLLGVVAGSQLFGHGKDGKKGDSDNEKDVDQKHPVLVNSPEECYILTPKNLKTIQEKLSAIEKELNGKSYDDIQNGKVGTEQIQDFMKFYNEPTDDATFAKNKVSIDDMGTYTTNIKKTCENIANMLKKTTEELKKQQNENADNSTTNTNNATITFNNIGKSVTISLDYINDITALVNEFNSLPSTNTETSESHEETDETDAEKGSEEKQPEEVKQSETAATPAIPPTAEDTAAKQPEPAKQSGGKTMKISEMFAYISKIKKNTDNFVYVTYNNRIKNFEWSNTDPNSRYIRYKEGNHIYIIPNQNNPFAKNKTSESVYDWVGGLDFADYNDTITFAEINKGGYIIKKGTITK